VSAYLHLPTAMEKHRCTVAGPALPALAMPTAPARKQTPNSAPLWAAAAVHAKRRLTAAQPAAPSGWPAPPPLKPGSGCLQPTKTREDILLQTFGPFTKLQNETCIVEAQEHLRNRIYLKSVKSRFQNHRFQNCPQLWCTVGLDHKPDLCTHQLSPGHPLH
jgi:hypothetical protein